MSSEIKDVKNFEEIAVTSSKGNQEKWYDKTSDRWYKVDMYGYEALAETMVSMLLEHSNIECATPFTFVRYFMVQVELNGRTLTGCYSANFLKEGQSVITLAKLHKNFYGTSLRDKLLGIVGHEARMQYIADMTAYAADLRDFSQYLSVLFDVDALCLNDDRHLNNIAVIENKDGSYDYCPIFDNGAGLLSNMRYNLNEALFDVKASPLGLKFTENVMLAHKLFGTYFKIPEFSEAEIRVRLEPLLKYYTSELRDIIAARVINAIMTWQQNQR